MPRTQEAKKLLNKAWFNLRKFASNSLSLQLRVIQDEAVPQAVATNEETFAQVTFGDNLELQENELKVLGVKWNNSEDQIGYTLESIVKAAETTEPTKRGIISTLGKSYDRMGFLSPVIIMFKVFMQALCEAKLGWDEFCPWAVDDMLADSSVWIE